jgi:hypothetical protein
VVETCIQTGPGGVTVVHLYEALVKSEAALIGLPLFVIAQVLVWQFLPERQKGVLFLVMVAAGSYAAVAALLAGPLGIPVVWHVWTSLPAFAFGTVAYMHLYFGIDRSLSMRTLGELVKSETGSLSRAQLSGVYPAEDMVQRRIDVLAAKGLLAREGSSYRCTPKGRLLVRAALAGKRLYALEVTG